MCVVGPGQREAVDQSLVHRAGVQLTAGRGGGGQKPGVSQKPRAAAPSRAAPGIPQAGTQPSAATPRK